MRHDRGTEDTCGGSGYNYGYREPNSEFRSILAYACNDSSDCDLTSTSGSCPRVQRFSNDEFTYNGKAIGNANADNARTINNNRVTVSNYEAGAPAGSKFLVDLGWSPTTSYPLSECEGDCDTDTQCQLGLKCHHRNDQSAVPGCFGAGTSALDYCIEPPLLNLGWTPSTSYPLGACEGDCDVDSHCATGLICRHRNDLTPIPGCTGSGTRSCSGHCSGGDSGCDS